MEPVCDGLRMPGIETMLVERCALLDPYALNMLGITEFQKGDMQSAQECFEMALKHGDPAGGVNLAILQGKHPSKESVEGLIEAPVVQEWSNQEPCEMKLYYSARLHYL